VLDLNNKKRNIPMNTGEEKFAQAEPFSETNDTDEINQAVDLDMNNVDELGKQAGLEMNDNEELGLKAKLEQRDDSRLDLDFTP
jgi:hypothetical protein